MTDAANGPSETAAAGEGDNRNATTVVGDQGSNAGDGIKVAGPLSEDNRALVEAKKWAGEDGSVDLNKVVEGYKNLESYSKQTLKVPGEGATKDDWDALYSKLGRPEKPDGYELKLNAEGIPEDFPYDETSAVEFRNWAHEAGLTPAQAQTLHDKFVGHQAGAFGAQKEQSAKAEGDAHRAITAKWGDPESEGYKQNAELMSRAVHQLGIKDALQKAGSLSGDGAIRSPELAFAMARVGKEMFAEDSMATGANGVISNPFSDGDSFNLTKQGQLLRSDPKKAKALISAAGKNPATYGL